MEKKSLLSQIWQSFSIDLPATTFNAMITTQTTWKDLFDMLDKFQELRNSYLGYCLGNSCHHILYKDTKFSFGIYGRVFDLWADGGATHLLSLSVKGSEEVPTPEEVREIINTIQDYCEGKICCSDCGRQICIDEIAGKYFAGVYCKDCWESKWKAIEARETYD